MVGTTVGQWVVERSVAMERSTGVSGQPVCSNTALAMTITGATTVGQWVVERSVAMERSTNVSGQPVCSNTTLAMTIIGVRGTAAVLLASQPGGEVEQLEEAGGSWKATLLARQPGVEVQYPEVADSEEEVHRHYQVSVGASSGVWYPEAAGSEEKVQRHHQVSMLEAGGSWRAMLLAVLLAVLLQLGRLLAMHAGSIVAGTWKLLRRRWKTRRGRGGGRGGSAVQQWWRQLRSYVHQQQCGRRQTSVEAGLEEAQGGAASGAALEAATPLVRARGGTKLMAGEATEPPAGAGGRGCCWCGWWCQQRQLVLLRQLEGRWQQWQLLLLLPARY